MLPLPQIIARIQALLAEGTDASVTYAALEARLALEKVCYDRLRQRHDYISHAQLSRWQPGAVMKTLVAEVDRHAAETITLSVGKSPLGPGVSPEDETEWAEVGTEIGFNSNRLSSMWQALSNLALHVRLPEHRDDQVADYGDKARIEAKVGEVVAELERLAKATMTWSGFGEEVSFVCKCGEKNRRRSELLRDGQEVFCINPDCHYTWKVCLSDHEVGFEAVTIQVNCESCEAENHLPYREFYRMRVGHGGNFSCRFCGHGNYVECRLMQRREQPPLHQVAEASSAP